MKGRSTGMLFLFIAVGVILGGFTGRMLADSSVGEQLRFLLTTYDLLDVSGIRLDLWVLKLDFGIHFFPNVWSLLFIILAIFVYKRWW